MSMGRVIDSSQKCHTKHTLPTIYRGPKARRRNANPQAPPPVFGSEKERRNVIPYLPKGGQKLHAEMPFEKCPLPSFLGQKRHTEMPQCLRPKGRVKISLQKCHVTNALPNQLKGAIEDHRNVIRATPRGGRAGTAEMPYRPRPHRIWVIHDAQKCHSSDYPITRGHPEIAAMP